MPNPQLPGVPTRGRATRHDIVAALVELLEREQRELTAPRIEVLEALAQEKEALCQALQPPARGAHTTAPAANYDDATRVLLSRAHRLNASNASLLAMHRVSCEGRLRSLRGGDQATTLYRANGYLQF